ncbi:B3 domain-containing protein REM16-like [Chenopodium quinoa]|uniref:B3 domain-containing protein REM16-like n=1 Tax=Chenopodium quinoa TaxID=63459 RepID=UPI000B790794|nr:B3 domain-containing protein REM16-like [Chenopodium quinoa]
MESENHKSWEEEIYWKNFHFARFSLILPTNFHHRLVLPKKFADHMRTHLPEKVALKVNGVTWHVNLEKEKNDVMFRGDGWQEFAKAYSLKKSDMLIFKYNKHECFEVLIFDQANLCEKEASYFVKKGLQPNSDGSDDSGGEVKETSAEELTDKNQGDDDSVDILGSRRRKNRDGFDGDDGDDTSDEENSVSSDDFTSPKKTATERVREVPSNFSRKRTYKVSEKSQKTIPKRKKSFALTYNSNRRPVTEAEKEKALKKARDTSKQYLNSFSVVMRPSCVYKRFFMSIPKEWEPTYVFKKGEEVILRVKEKTWVCTFICNRYTGGFAGGWKRFAVENFLEEFDVCLFVPVACSNVGKSVLDVSIFRVTPVVVQPSPVTTSNVDVQEIPSEDGSLGDDDSDYASRNRKRQNNSGATPKGHYSGSNPKKGRCEDEGDESSDEEKTSTEDCTPKKAAGTARVREVTANSNGKTGKTTPDKNGTFCESSVRQATEAEKNQALKKAKIAAAQYKHQYPLIEVMRPSSVRRRFFLSFSKDWKIRRKLRNDQEVILRVKEKTWTCTFSLSSNNVGLLSGWKHFVPDNKLEEDDVCVFVPVGEQNRKLVLDVIIFRARPEID